MSHGMIGAQLYGYSPIEPSPYEAFYNPDKYEKKYEKQPPEKMSTNKKIGIAIIIIIAITIIVCIFIIAFNKNKNKCIPPPVNPKDLTIGDEKIVKCNNSLKLYKIETFSNPKNKYPNDGYNRTMYTFGSKTGAITAFDGKLNGGFFSCKNDVGTTQMRLCRTYTFSSKCLNDDIKMSAPLQCIKSKNVCVKQHPNFYNYNTHWVPFQ